MSTSNPNSFPIQLRLLSPSPYPMFTTMHSSSIPTPRTFHFPSETSGTSGTTSPSTLSFKSLTSSAASSPSTSIYHSISPSHSSSPSLSPSLSDVDEKLYVPQTLTTPAELHIAIKSSKCALIFVYSRAATTTTTTTTLPTIPTKTSQAYQAFLTFATQNHASPTTKHELPRYSLPRSLARIQQLPVRRATGFYVVCMEDVKAHDIPLMFGRLGVLPSRVASAGSAVSAQRGGVLWRCVVGKGGVGGGVGGLGVEGLEGLLRDVRGEK